MQYLKECSNRNTEQFFVFDPEPGSNLTLDMLICKYFPGPPSTSLLLEQIISEVFSNA